MDMNPHSLLTYLAEELLLLANRYVADVVTMGDSAAAPIPYGPFMHAQRAATPPAYQLPEPILHPLQSPAVLVIGLNPGYGNSELMPCLGTPLDEYVDWYAHRFDSNRRDDKGRPAAKYLEDRQTLVRHVIHYTKVEELLLSQALGPHSLGRDAVYCDAIPWKWANSNKTVRPRMTRSDWENAWFVAAQRIETIAVALNPRVVLTLGEPGEKIFNRASTKDGRPAPTTIGHWHGVHVASAHLAAWGKTSAYWATIAESVAIALEQ